MTQEQQIQGNLELDDNVTVDDNELGARRMSILEKGRLLFSHMIMR